MKSSDGLTVHSLATGLKKLLISNFLTHILNIHIGLIVGDFCPIVPHSMGSLWVACPIATVNSLNKALQTCPETVIIKTLVHMSRCDELRIHRLRRISVSIRDPSEIRPSSFGEIGTLMTRS